MSANCISKELLNAKVQEWLEWDQNPDTRAAISKLVAENNTKALIQKLLSRLSFGKYMTGKILLDTVGMRTLL